ncbi:MAG: NAD(P)H-dependent oxidoreductase, partial [Clostridia bacterium]|nr:NAD(P)H-dependent oxidoreductase [Clostridia bacterium]
MNKILYINTCVRANSRTNRLAKAVLEKLEGKVKEVRPLDFGLEPLTERMLEERTAACKAGDYTDPTFDAAADFAEADTIVIAAPFWDFSFPAQLKIYIERIMVEGLTFRYGADGNPERIIKATRLIYVSTAGGPIVGSHLGYDYIAALAKYFWQIP